MAVESKRVDSVMTMQAPSTEMPVLFFAIGYYSLAIVACTRTWSRRRQASTMGVAIVCEPASARSCWERPAE